MIDFALTHKPKFSGPKHISSSYRKDNDGSATGGASEKRSSASRGMKSTSNRQLSKPRSHNPRSGLGPVCHYCKKKGHVISHCWTLKGKEER